VKAPRMLKSGGSTAVPLCFIKLQKENFKKRISWAENVTRRSVTMDKGKN